MAGAFTLLFGLLVLLSGLVLVVLSISSLFTRLTAVSRPIMSFLAHLQCMSLMSMVVLWFVGGHQLLAGETPNQDGHTHIDGVRIGASWIIGLVTSLVGITNLFYFTDSNARTKEPQYELPIEMGKTQA